MPSRFINEQLNTIWVFNHKLIMIDLYIKRIVIHQFTPNDTELILSDQLLTITPRIDEYFRKKLSKVFSDEAKRGMFAEDNVFLSYLSDDLMESSVKIAQLWKEEFVISENQKQMIWFLSNLTKTVLNILPFFVLL